MKYDITSIELKTFDGEVQKTWTVKEIYSFVKEEIEILELWKNIKEFKISVITQVPIEGEKAACFSVLGEIKKLNGEIILEDELYYPAKHKIYPEDTKCLVKGTHIVIAKIG
jgi:hypothetical protein